MNGFRTVALAAFVGWCSALVVLSAQGAGGAAPAAAPAGDQQTRGKALYLDKCSTCHQESLKGTSESPPLTGDMFWMNWETYTANNLLEQIRTTMPEDDPGSLARQAYVDIVAYILRVNEVPLTGDLPTDADSLKKIIVKMKDK
jgi:cytochrome c